jgi:prepilin-type N-terminal cleavage/methylation domain-containing protein
VTRRPPRRLRLLGSWGNLPVPPGPQRSAGRTGRSGFASAAGYSLIELLTVLLILGLVLGGLTSLFVSATTAEVDLVERFDAQQEARLAVDALRREVHCANAITQTGPSPTVTITLPAGCPTGSGTVTWCTVNVAASRYQLYRKAGATCDSAGRRYADYLKSDATTPVCGSPAGLCVFSYTAPTATTRAKLHVALPVDLTPTDAQAAYKLVDDLVLRNTNPTS